MTRMALVIALAALAAPFTAAAKDPDITTKTVIGRKMPNFEKCYENALNLGGDDFDEIEPCNVALESEQLTPRRTAIVYVNRGVIYYNLGEYHLAVDDFSAALDGAIHVKAKVLVNRGLSYEALNEDQRARRDYQAALAFNPENITAKRRLEELEKPLYERSRPPSRINAGHISGPSVGI